MKIRNANEDSFLSKVIGTTISLATVLIITSAVRYGRTLLPTTHEEIKLAKWIVEIKDNHANGIFEKVSEVDFITKNKPYKDIEKIIRKGINLQYSLHKKHGIKNEICFNNLEKYIKGERKNSSFLIICKKLMQVSYHAAKKVSENIDTFVQSQDMDSEIKTAYLNEHKKIYMKSLETIKAGYFFFNFLSLNNHSIIDDNFVFQTNSQVTLFNKYLQNFIATFKDWESYENKKQNYLRKLAQEL